MPQQSQFGSRHHASRPPSRRQVCTYFRISTGFGFCFFWKLITGNFSTKKADA
jgi:hypothetical protein